MNFALFTTIDASMSWFILPYAYELKKRGHHVVLCCNMSSDFVDKYKKDFELINVDLDRGFNLKKTITSFFFFLKLFKNRKFDLIECATDNVSFPCLFAAKIRKIPIRVYDHWGVMFVAFKGIKRKIVKFIERFSIRNSTDVRQVSYGNMDFCYKNHLYSSRKHVKVLGKGGTIGVDLNRFNFLNKEKNKEEILNQYNIPKNAFILGFVGRIQKDKGINELIMSFRKILKKNNRVYLFLVGFIDNTNPIDFENLKWAKNCKNIIFTGRVSNTEKYLGSFDVLVHPTYREGFGMVLQEAGAMKTPIITTNIIGPSEFIKNGITGTLVEARNEKSLFDAITFVINNYKIAIKMANNCYKYTVDFFERKMMINRMADDRISLIGEKQC